MKYTLLLLFVCLCLSSFAQLDTCNVFLKGNYLEAGINQAGGFGSTVSAPSGYYAKPVDGPGGQYFYNPCDTGTPYTTRNSVGFIADPDKDGWTAGSPAFYGDYFLPGYPQEGWSIAMNDSETSAYTGRLNSSGNTGFSSVYLTGSNTSYNNSGKTASGTWEGVYFKNAATKMSIKQIVSIDTNALYLVCHITLKNTGTATLRKVYYMRTVEPDDDVTVSHDYTTRNVVTAKLPNAQNKVVVSTWGLHYPAAYCGLGTFDCRARAFVNQSGLTPTSSSAKIYNGTAGTSVTYDSSNSDNAVGIVFSLDTIAVNDSVTFSFAYVFKESEFDSVMTANTTRWAISGDPAEHVSGDTAYLCHTDTAYVTVSNTQYNTWSWTSLSGAAILSTSGATAAVVLSSTTAVLRVIGNTTAPCLPRDTTFIVLQPGVPQTPFIRVIAPVLKNPGTVVDLYAIVKNAGPAYLISWYKNGSLLGTSHIPFFSYTKTSGTDTITATVQNDGTGCYDTAVSNTSIVHDASLLASSITIENDIVMSPNPVTHEFTLSNLIALDQITVYDATGRKAAEWIATKDGSNIFNVSSFLSGVYIIRVQDKNGNIKAKIPLQKL